MAALPPKAEEEGKDVSVEEKEEEGRMEGVVSTGAGAGAGVKDAGKAGGGKGDGGGGKKKKKGKR